MATDGKQIRSKDKVYGEQNHSKTCKTSDNLLSGSLVKAGGPQSLARHTITTKGIIVTDALGNISFLAVPSGAAGYNKLLAVDASGNLTWVDK